MDYVPSELCIEIFGGISRSDLKSIRLVSKKLNALSSPLLFTRVYASLHLKDLEVLSAISRHPILSLFVKEIVYSGVFFHLSKIKASRNVSEEEPLSQYNLERGREYYRQRVEESEMILRDREDVAIISTALSRMPNIRMVTLTNHWRPTRDLLGKCSWSERFLGLVDLPEGARFGGPLSRVYPSYAKVPCGLPLRIGDPKTGGMSIDHGFRVMSRALSIANARVRMLSIDYFNDSSRSLRSRLTSGISPGSFHMSPRDFVHSCNAFRYLHKVAFSLWMENTDNEWDILMQGNIAKLLAAAEELEALTFDFNHTVDNIPLEKFLGSLTWPRLRSIRLFRKEMHQEELAGLLERHCKTLKVLCLDSVNLKSGTWLDTAEEIRGCLSLGFISLCELGERVDPWNVKTAITEHLEDYIIHGVSGAIYRPNYRPGTPTRFTTASIV